MNIFRNDFGTLRVPFYHMWSLYRDIANGLYGLYYWAPFAWRWRSWDYSDVLKATEHGLRALEPVVRDGDGVEGKKRAQEMRVALELLRRIDADEYFLNLYVTKDDWERRFDIDAAARERDWDMLFEVLRKRMRRWWN